MQVVLVTARPLERAPEVIDYKLEARQKEALYNKEGNNSNKKTGFFSCEIVKFFGHVSCLQDL